jgi:hypothetical protein
MYGLSSYKTQPCKNILEEGFCRYGSSCQFAHSKVEMEMAAERGPAGVITKVREANKAMSHA